MSALNEGFSFDLNQRSIDEPGDLDQCVGGTDLTEHFTVGARYSAPILQPHDVRSRAYNIRERGVRFAQG